MRSFEQADFLQLPNHRIYLKLMIDGTPSAPFSAATLAPGTPPYPPPYASPRTV